MHDARCTIRDAVWCNDGGGNGGKEGVAELPPYNESDAADFRLDPDLALFS